MARGACVALPGSCPLRARAYFAPRFRRLSAAAELFGGGEELEERREGAEQAEREQRQRDQPNGAQVDVAAAQRGVKACPADQERHDGPDRLARQGADAVAVGQRVLEALARLG